MARHGRRRADDDEGDSKAWLGTYGDMVTLLMAFFVMLYAISQVDEQKFAELVRGLDVFGNRTNVDGMLRSGPELLDEGVAPSSVDLAREVEQLSLDTPRSGADIEPEVRQVAPTVNTSEPPDTGQIDRSDQVEQVRARLEAALTERGLPVDVSDVRPDLRGVVISVSSDDVLFSLGSTDISRIGRRIVAAIGDVLRSYASPVVVEGHTDDLPLDRAGYTNWNLSTDRAVEVTELLIDRHRIDPRRLSASGHGRFQPIASNDTRSGRARNRRVDVLLLLDGGR